MAARDTKGTRKSLSPRQEGTVAALGFFDGVHRGHRAILHKAVELGDVQGRDCIAVTFENQPRSFLKRQKPELIVPFARRCALLEQAGMKQVVALKFDRAMAQTSPEEFAAMLRDKYQVKTVVCGENYRFGKKAEGTPDTLRELGFDTHVVPPVIYSRRVVSSTWIRECIREGKMPMVHSLLGKPFQMEGTVEHGFQTGRTLGFPTINLTPPKQIVLPRRGVYVTLVTLEKGIYRAVTNVGTRPTFTDEDNVSIESYLLDYSGELLYDKLVQVRFMRYLRPEMRFENGDALREQIEKDVQAAKHWNWRRSVRL